MHEKLTPREQDIFDLLLEGLSLKEIAYKLNISYSTADNYRGKIYLKLGVKSIQELYIKYSQNENLKNIADITNTVDEDDTVDKVDTIDTNESEPESMISVSKVKKLFLLLTAAFLLIICVFIVIIVNSQNPESAKTVSGLTDINRSGFIIFEKNLKDGFFLEYPG